MFEFHGWATIRSTQESEEREDEDEVQVSAVDNVRAFVQHLDWRWTSNQELDLQVMNGQAQLWATGCHNHKGPEGEELLALFRHVAHVAPGSYGLVYMMDDEDPVHGNEFRVYVLARGSVTERQDPFLSPFRPIVEGP